MWHPSPAVACAAPAPVSERVEPTPAVSCATPASANEVVTPTPALTHAAPARRLRKKAKQKAYGDEDALEKAIQQAEERAMEADRRQCQCGLSLPSRVDGQGDCRNCGRSLEGRNMLRCQESSFVLCPRCILGAVLKDLVATSALCPRQLKEIGHDSRAVYEVISAWVRRLPTWATGQRVWGVRTQCNTGLWMCLL